MVLVKERGQDIFILLKKIQVQMLILDRFIITNELQLKQNLHKSDT